MFSAGLPSRYSLPLEFQSVPISDEEGRAYQLVVEAKHPGPYEQYFIEKRHYQPLSRLLMRLLRSQGTLIDLGTNIGTVCLPVAMAESRVVAVEVLPRNASKLRADAQLNGLEHMRVVEAAVTSSDGPVGFLGSEAWGHISDTSESGQAAGLRLDTIVEQIRTAEPEFFQLPAVMKIDVEGFLINAENSNIPPHTEVAILDITADGVKRQSRICVQGELAPGVFTPVRFRFALSADATQVETRVALIAPLAMTMAAAVALAEVDE